MKDIIEQKSELLMIGGGTPSWDKIKNIKANLYRDFQKVKWKMIQVKSEKTKKLVNVLKKGDIRFLPNRYKSNMAILTYSDRACLFIVDNDLTLIQIIGKNQAKAFKNYFEIIWNVATP
jgi:hypothetical protein